MIDILHTYCLGEKRNKVSYKVKVDGINLLVFYCAKTERFSGVFENGIMFNSTMRRWRKEAWFKQLVEFFKNGG